MDEQQKAALKQVKAMIATLIAGEKDAQNTAWPTLAASFPHAVAEPKGQRHEMQEQMLSLLESQLQDCLTATRQQQVEMATATEAAEKEAEEGAAVAKAAEDELASCAKALEDRQAASRSAEEEAEANKEARSEIEAAKISASKHLATCQQDHAQACSVTSGPLKLLSEGGWEDEETRAQCFEAVQDLLKNAGAEPAMLAGLQGTFRQKPEKRGRFDKAIEAGAGEVAEAHVAALKAVLDSSSINFEETDAEALGLWAIADLSKEAASQAEEHVAAATEVLSQAKRRRLDADKQVACLKRAVVDAKAMQAQVDTKSSQLVESCKSLEGLREWEPRPASSEPSSMEGITETIDIEVVSPKATRVAEEADAAVAGAQLASPVGGA